MLTPTQIQRMCTNYYVADYEVRRFPLFIYVYGTHASHGRLPSHRRSSVSWLHGFRPTTATTTCSLHQKPKKSAPMSCRCLARCLAWRRTFPHTSTYRTSGDWLLWLHSGLVDTIMAVMLIQFLFVLHIFLCYGIQCNGNLRFPPNHSVWHYVRATVCSCCRASCPPRTLLPLPSARALLPLHLARGVVISCLVAGAVGKRVHWMNHTYWARHISRARYLIKLVARSLDE